MSKYIDTIIFDDAEVDVYGYIQNADPTVGLMADYVEIDDLQIGKVSVYTLFSNNGLLDKVEEAVNDRLGA